MASGFARGSGAVAGALLVSHVPLRWLAAAMPFALILIALYFGFAPRIGDVATRPRMGVRAFTLTIAPLVGFYDGVFGPAPDPSTCSASSRFSALES